MRIERKYNQTCIKRSPLG